MYLWQWWQALGRRRPVSMGGVSPLSHVEVQAWATLTQRRPSAQEVETIMALDDTFLGVLAEDDAKRAKRQP